MTGASDDVRNTVYVQWRDHGDGRECDSIADAFAAGWTGHELYGRLPDVPPNQYAEVAGRTVCTVCWQFDGEHTTMPGHVGTDGGQRANAGVVAAVLLEHHRDTIQGCRCGWGMDGSKLGQSHAEHVALILLDLFPHPAPIAQPSDVLDKLRAAAEVAYKGPNHTDHGMLRRYADNIRRGRPGGGGNLTDAVARVLDVVADELRDVPLAGARMYRETFNTDVGSATSFAPQFRDAVTPPPTTQEGPTND